ncbi:hypothetical protein O181_064721 [Austropuccinia psidii MF-1]|uniref:Uncharacterized protein n=1 Tax=Austropuccinia psidii MF-1 TaxID=1389203 RepID=A0A9Q3EU88_9BASI|nr:hypothetical protein [Austropuccinia psidii MF-1]
MVTIGPSSNVLTPSPSFIGQKMTSLRLKSEVTIGWWPRKGVDKLILEGTGLIMRNRSHLPVWDPGVHSILGILSFSSTTKESSQGHLGQELLWLRGRKGWTMNKHFLCACWQASQASVVVKEQMQGIPRLVHKVPTSKNKTIQVSNCLESKQS